MRILIGILLLFSGGVKLLDPVGMELKVDAYFNYWQITEMMEQWGLTKIIVSLLAVGEFLLGVGMIVLRNRKFDRGVYAFFVAMTLVTIYIYVYNPVTDCGCFGDALNLTNGETLLKNVVLLVLMFFVIRNERYDEYQLLRRGYLVKVEMFYSLICAVSLLVYSFRNLPLYEFTIWKQGLNISASFLSDSLDKRTLEVQSFYIEDDKHEDKTFDIILNNEKLALFVVKDLSKLSQRQISALQLQLKENRKLGIANYLITNIENQSQRRLLNVDVPIYYGDGSLLHSLLRSGAGVIYIKDGIVGQKYGSREWGSVFQNERNVFSVMKNTKKNVMLLLLFIVPLGFIEISDRLSKK